tara:strand:+ start:608 stop:1495 length:888 start_codon:yes stop_codon:yes gene_type:complete
MNNGNKIILLSFASDDLKKSINRFKRQAEETNFYDKIRIITYSDLDNNFKLILKKLLLDGKKKGFGYFMWKPYLVKKILEEINYGDIVNYMDIGFHLLKENRKKFGDYLKFINMKNNWILTFQYHTKMEKKPDNISFPHREERKYSKGDLLDFFNFYNNPLVTETPQYMAGCFFIKKSEKSMSFINEWLDIFYKRFDLVDDTVSKLENLNGFLEHRHDQSAFSLLCKKYNLESFSAYECDWAYSNNERTWIHNRESPFLAKRDLEYSILKRFYNRQKKTYLRKKKRLVNLWQKIF